MSPKPFDLIGIDMRPRDFDRGRQIEDQRIVGGGLNDRNHRLADFEGKFRLSRREGLGRIFKAEARFRLLGRRIDQQLRTFFRQGHNVGAFHAEDNATEKW